MKLSLICFVALFLLSAVSLLHAGQVIPYPPPAEEPAGSIWDGIGFFPPEPTAPSDQAVFLDEFEGGTIDRGVWEIATQGIGPSVEVNGGLLEFEFPADCSGQVLEARLSSLQAWEGDLDVEMDFDLSTWPGDETGSGVRLALMAGPDGASIQRLNLGPADHYPDELRENYLFEGLGELVFLPSGSRSGSLRLTREDKVWSGYVLEEDEWTRISYTLGSDSAVTFSICALATKSSFMRRDVRLVVDNFAVTQGTPIPMAPAISSAEVIENGR